VAVGRRSPELNPLCNRKFLLEKPDEINVSFGKDYVAALARPVAQMI
jgi:hypothetical protein